MAPGSNDCVANLRKAMHPRFQDDLLHKYSDPELADFIFQSPTLQAFPCSIHTLSEILLAKHYSSLAEAQDAADAIGIAVRLGIRAPRILRIVTNQTGAAYCIMERIQGTTLEKIWAELSWYQTLRITLQLQRSLVLLQSISSSTAGSLSTGECRSFWFEDRYQIPARSTAVEISSFFHFWVGFTSIRKAMNPPPVVSAEIVRKTPQISAPFVLVHHDLAPRNLILDSSGYLWLVDWDLAGFYPVFFENAAMQNFNIPQTWGAFAKLRWFLFSSISAGYYRSSAKVLASIRSKFTRFRVGRRMFLLKYGGPTRFPVS